MAEDLKPESKLSDEEVLARGVVPPFGYSFAHDPDVLPRNVDFYYCGFRNYEVRLVSS
jgi:hypothetical protein